MNRDSIVILNKDLARTRRIIETRFSQSVEYGTYFISSGSGRYIM